MTLGRPVSVTPDGKLWGLDMEQRLVKHQTKFYTSAVDESTKSSDDTSADSNAEQAAGNDHVAELYDFEVV